jgi:hypothetical protein
MKKIDKSLYICTSCVYSPCFADNFPEITNAKLLEGKSGCPNDIICSEAKWKKISLEKKIQIIKLKTIKESVDNLITSLIGK